MKRYGVVFFHKNFWVFKGDQMKKLFTLILIIVVVVAALYFGKDYIKDIPYLSDAAEFVDEKINGLLSRKENKAEAVVKEDDVENPQAEERKSVVDYSRSDVEAFFNAPSVTGL